MATIKIFSMYVGGLVFGLGLAIAGATIPEVVLSFLTLQDLGLALVIGTALVVTLVVYQGSPKLLGKPPFGEFFDGHDGFPVTAKAIIGAVLFGFGWGLSGLCPATSLAAVGVGNYPVVLGVLGMFIGTFIYGVYKTHDQ